MMTANPFQVVAWMLLTGMLIGGYCLRIFERPLNASVNLNFADFTNGM